MPTVSKLSTQSNESYQFISTEIFSLSSERHGFLGQHVLCSEVNKAKARAFKAKALNTSQSQAKAKAKGSVWYTICHTIFFGN